MTEKKTEPTKQSTEPEKEWEVTTERFVAFFDIMGFKERVANNSHEKIIKDLLSIKAGLDAIEDDKTLGLDSESKRIKTTIFSDTIMLFSEDASMSSLYAILLCSSYIVCRALIEKIPVKGTLSCGKITVDHHRSLYFGKPIINAYLLHEEICFYGMVLDESAEKKLAEYNSERLTPRWSILYNVPFKFGKAKHHALNWSWGLSVITNTRESLTPIQVLQDLKFVMSGKPRLYLDNTIDFYNYCVSNGFSNINNNN